MDAQERPTEGDQMLCMTAFTLYAKKTVFETGRAGRFGHMQDTRQNVSAKLADLF